MSDVKLLKLPTVAAFLDVSVCHARRLCETGRLPAKNVGTGKSKVWRVRSDDLAAFVPPAPETQKKQSRPMMRVV